MGGMSKPKKEKFQPGELAKANLGISRDILEGYDFDREQEMVKRLAADETPYYTGRANTDAQQTVQGLGDMSIARAQTSGGLGSGASVGAFDAGLYGSAQTGAVGAAEGQATGNEIGQLAAGAKMQAQGLYDVQGISSQVGNIQTGRVLEGEVDNYAGKMQRFGDLLNFGNEMAGGIMGGQDFTANKVARESYMNSLKNQNGLGNQNIFANADFSRLGGQRKSLYSDGFPDYMRTKGR